MRVEVSLLGRPAITVDGEPRELAGHKPWALLARVALGPPNSRRDLGKLLWTDVSDPMAACRWTILHVRRALEPAATLSDDAGTLRLVPSPGHELVVDVLSLHDGSIGPTGLVHLDHLLLRGIEVRDAAEFDLWLAGERNRAVSALGATLRWAATVIGTTDARAGITFARQALRLDAFDDAAHETLLSLLMTSGHRRGAARHLQETEARYRDELGIELPDQIRRGLDVLPPPASPISSPASAHALLELATGRAAAGDYSGAIEASRRAVADAGELPALTARALLSWGSILVHSIRGRDEEAIGLLDRALHAAVAAGDELTAAEAEREIAWVRFLRAEYGAAEGVLRRSMSRSEAIGDHVGRARALVVLGACQSDRAEYDAAVATLAESIDLLRATGDQWEAFALAFLGRVRLLTGSPREALELAEQAVTRCRETGWLSLLPWPMVVAAEAALCLDPETGDGGRFDHAHALACELGDPCWEAFSLRGKGLLARATGAEEEAVQLLTAGLERARALPDVYAWAVALILTDLVELERGSEPHHLAAALELAGRGPMPALMERITAATTVSPTPAP